MLTMDSKQATDCPGFVAAERWVARQLGDAAHECRVARIAAVLFEITRPLHALSPADLRLLRLAALVHDVGRCVDKPTHPIQGARMVLADSTLPVSPRQRRALAYLTRYHKGPVKALDNDDILADAYPLDRLRMVLALLRAADALDSRSLQSPRLLFALEGGLSAGAACLRVTCYLETDSEKARRVYRRRKKFRLLEREFGLRVEIAIVHAHALRMVA